MSESAAAKKARKERARLYAEELSLRTSLQEDDEIGYISERRLISMMTNADRIRARGIGEPLLIPVDSVDLERMIKEILRWRRGMLTRHEVKRYFAR